MDELKLLLPQDYGEKLLSQNHFASEDIQHTVQQLDKVWTQLNEVWEDRKQLLTQCYDLQVDFKLQSNFPERPPP